MTTNAFGVSKSFISVTLRLAIEATVKIIRPQYIHLPSAREEIQEATTAFEVTFGLPQLLGCVDGTHIPIFHLTRMISSDIN